jgi:hypothetical protein
MTIRLTIDGGPISERAKKPEVVTLCADPAPMRSAAIELWPEATGFVDSVTTKVFAQAGTPVAVAR